jgi:hypothetical protein
MVNPNETAAFLHLTAKRHHLMRSRRLAQQFPAPVPNVAAKHCVTILRYPDQMILAVPNRVATTLVRFHPTNLHCKRRDPSRLKAWGFLIPYRGL